MTGIPVLAPTALRGPDNEPLVGPDGRAVYGAVGVAGLADGQKIIVRQKNGTEYNAEITGLNAEFPSNPTYAAPPGCEPGDLISKYEIVRLSKDGRRLGRSAPASAGGSGPSPAALNTIRKAICALAQLVAHLAAGAKDTETMDAANQIASDITPKKDWHAIGQAHAVAIQKAAGPEAAAEAANKAVLELAQAPAAQKKALMTVADTAGLVWDAESKVFSAPAEEDTTDDDEQVPF